MDNHSLCRSIVDEPRACRWFERFHHRPLSLSLPLLAIVLLSGCSKKSPSDAACTAHPSGSTTKTPEFLYSTNGDSSTSVYVIDSKTGALTDIPGSPLYAYNYASYLVIDPSGNYAVGPGSGGGIGVYVSQFNIDQSNGELSVMLNQHISSSGGVLLDLSIDPLNRYEYLDFPGGIDSRSSANGTEVVVLPNHTEGQGDPSGHFVYASVVQEITYPRPAPLMAGFTIDPVTGTWLELSASPFQVPDTGRWAFHPSGKFIYMAGDTGTFAFAIDPTQKTWTVLNHIDHDNFAGFNAKPLALDPAGRFAYAMSAVDSQHPRPDGQLSFQISAYPINQTTGELTGPTCAGAWVGVPISLVVDPSGLFLYVAGVDGISAYAIDQSNGGLAEIAGSPFVYAAANGKQISGPVGLAVIGLADAGVQETPPAVPVGMQMGGAHQGTALSLSGKVTTTAGWPPCFDCQASPEGGGGGFVGRSSTDGTGLGARFYHPDGITTDGLALYVADNYGHTIRKVDPYTRKVTTIAGQAGVAGAVNGTGSAARFNSPTGITTDGTNLYVADTGNKLIRKMVIATGEVTTLAGGGTSWPVIDGTGTAARFLYPRGITTDGTNLYIADTFTTTIRRVVTATGEVTTLAGFCHQAQNGSCVGYGTPGVGVGASFLGPADITTDGTSLYLLDGEQLLWKISPSSGTLAAMTSATAVVTGLDSVTTTSGIRFTGLACDGPTLYISDGFTVAKINLATYAPGQALTTIAGEIAGSANGVGIAAGFSLATGMTTDGTSLFVTDNDNDNIRRIQ